MTISAKVITDSISQQGIRMTTFLLRYPRFIHSEFMTHHDIAKNSSSSRAIPTAKLIEDMRRDPAMPIYWGANQKGMQAAGELGAVEIESCKKFWLEGMELAINTANELQLRGLHKQIANRVLEPWAHMNVVATATRWENFYGLRRHTDAQPEIHALADCMFDAQQNSTPVLLKPLEWHLPFADRMVDWRAAEAWLQKRMVTRDMPTNREVVEVLKKVSAARCARTSYMTFEGKESTVEEDMAIWDKLVTNKPIHASPTEHQGTPDFVLNDVGLSWANPELHAMMHGWVQHRKLIPGEYISA